MELVHIFRIGHDFLNQFKHIHLRRGIEEFKNHGRKFLQFLLGRRRNRTSFHAHDAFKHGHAAFIGIVHQLLHRGGADASFWYIDDTGQADVISEIVNHLQIGQHVSDFCPVIETGAAHHGVADAFSDQTFFDHTGLGIHAIQYRHIAVGTMIHIMFSFHGVDNEFRFAMFILGGVVLQMAAHVIFCPKSF